MNAKINIITTQYDEHGKTDTIKVDVLGNIVKKNDHIYLIYKEKEEGIEVTTTIKILDDEISVKRFGGANSTMVFKKGSNHATKYKTPQGMFIIDTDTKELEIDIKENEYIKIGIDYNISIMNIFNGRNKMEIYVVPEIK